MLIYNVGLWQKFRAYFLDLDKCMDVVAYLLCYALEIKDKPRKHFSLFDMHCLCSIFYNRTAWLVPCSFVHHPDIVRGEHVWDEANSSAQGISTPYQMECWRCCCRFSDQCTLMCRLGIIANGSNITGYLFHRCDDFRVVDFALSRTHHCTL